MSAMTIEMQKISEFVRNGIESYAQEAYDDGFRTHLGASLIGDTCRRKLWFIFRWVHAVKHNGRMYRLFNTGHKEELRIIEWLRGSGRHVLNEDSEGNQFKISAVCGHFGGSVDGIVEVPGLGTCLLECKTSKCGAEFKGLFEHGMQSSKPQHWAQTCTYGLKLRLEHALYICKNKCNDDLYIEPVKLDWSHGEDMIRKAESIVWADEAPPRESEKSDFWKCKMCGFVDVCHKGANLAVNCRSCANCRPIEDKQWECSDYGAIPSEYIPNGCANWKAVY